METRETSAAESRPESWARAMDYMGLGHIAADIRTLEQDRADLIVVLRALLFASDPIKYGRTPDAASDADHLRWAQKDADALLARLGG